MASESKGGGTPRYSIEGWSCETLREAFDYAETLLEGVPFPAELVNSVTQDDVDVLAEIFQDLGDDRYKWIFKSFYHVNRHDIDKGIDAGAMRNQVMDLVGQGAPQARLVLIMLRVRLSEELIRLPALATPPVLRRPFRLKVADLEADRDRLLKDVEELISKLQAVSFHQRCVAGRLREETPNAVALLRQVQEEIQAAAETEISFPRMLDEAEARHLPNKLTLKSKGEVVFAAAEAVLSMIEELPEGKSAPARVRMLFASWGVLITSASIRKRRQRRSEA